MEYSYVYILSNNWRTTLYIGVTTGLVKRIWQHKQKMVKGFTQKYNVDRLVYYEQFENVEEAIKREKQLKGGARNRKIELIERMNPGWKDLYDKLL